MHKFSDHNYTDSNENADMNYLIPVRLIVVALHENDVKVENDLSVHKGIIKTEDRIDYDMVNRATSPQRVAIDGMKVEYDDGVNQDITNLENISTEHMTSSDMVCRATVTEDVIHDIKAETEDLDVECGSTSTKDFITDDIKVEVIQEIITPEELTNIEMMCRSTLPSDVGLNSVEVDNCSVTNQDGASGSATNSEDVKCEDVLLGEDYSSVDGLPSAETIHKVESSDTGVQQVTKVPDDSTRLAYNMSALPEEKPFSCEVCHKRFGQKRLLKPHMRIHSGEKPYSCEVCHKTFRQNSTFLRHMKMHLGERPFSCEVCHKKFIRKDQFTSHMMTHLGNRPFSCDICKNAFTLKRTLLDHIRTHTKEKPFSCEICHKAFIKKSYFTYHMRTHSGDRPFSCDICDKSFYAKWILKTHRRTHTGEKPFSCDICHKRFTQKPNLTSHLRKHSGEKPFSCNVCNKSFISKAQLKSHWKTHYDKKISLLVAR